MTFDEAMLHVKAEGKRLKGEGRAFTISSAMRMLWELADAEKMRMSVELLARMEAPPAPPTPEPVSGDAEAVARLTRISDIGPLVGTLPGPRE